MRFVLFLPLSGGQARLAELAAVRDLFIAPFFADMDTTRGGIVTYGTSAYDGHSAFGVNWIGVGRYGGGSQPNSFQLILVDRSDIGAGEFDIIFNYDNIQWDTGSASHGVSAYAGWSNGNDTFYELDGSGINGAFLNGGANALVAGSLNTNRTGSYTFLTRGGALTHALPATPKTHVPAGKHRPD